MPIKNRLFDYSMDQRIESGGPVNLDPPSGIPLPNGEVDSMVCLGGAHLTILPHMLTWPIGMRRMLRLYFVHHVCCERSSTGIDEIGALSMIRGDFKFQAQHFVSDIPA